MLIIVNKYNTSSNIHNSIFYLVWKTWSRSTWCSRLKTRNNFSWPVHLGKDSVWNREWSTLMVQQCRPSRRPPPAVSVEVSEEALRMLRCPSRTFLQPMALLRTWDARLILRFRQRQAQVSRTKTKAVKMVESTFPQLEQMKPHHSWRRSDPAV